jgi:hypothetical protein
MKGCTAMGTLIPDAPTTAGFPDTLEEFKVFTAEIVVRLGVEDEKNRNAIEAADTFTVLIDVIGDYLAEHQIADDDPHNGIRKAQDKLLQIRDLAWKKIESIDC